MPTVAWALYILISDDLVKIILHFFRRGDWNAQWYLIDDKFFKF